MTTLSPTTRDALVVKPSGRDKRGRVTEIPTSDPAVCLSVSTWHRPPTWSAKEPLYVTQVLGVRHLPRDGSIFSSTLSAPLSSKTVELTKAGGRFSQKHLDAAHEAGLARVLELIDGGITGDLSAVLAETPTH